MRRAITESQSQQKLVPYTPNEAVALRIDGRKLKRDYSLIRIGAKERGADIYPSYYSAFTIRSTLADLVFLRDRKLVPLCRLLTYLLLWVLL